MKDECYEFIKNQIGKTNIVGFGSYGQVKIAKNTENSQIVAIKLIHGKNAKSQIDVHHKLNHPNIIKLLNYYYQKQKNITYMVLQYAENGSLNEKIKFGLGQLSKQLIRRYFKDICEAIKYLHKHNYMHRDIKPQNILITKDNVAKLCDFGFAAIFQARTTMCGTFQYMAPEMIKKRHYNYKIDIWALGILLFQMIQGIAPFRGQTGQQVIGEMKKPIKFSQRFQSLEIDLIKKILRVNAQNRPTVQQILDHPYFKYSKQQQKLSPKGHGNGRNTIQFGQTKQVRYIQPHQLLKQKFGSSKEQLTNFLKNSNEKIITKNILQFQQSKQKNQLTKQPYKQMQRSPFRNNTIKTQPAIRNDQLLNKSSQNILSYKNQKVINNQQCQSNIRTQNDTRKYSNNIISPQNQRKTKSPTDAKSQLFFDNFNSIKAQRKTPIYSNSNNQFNSSIGTINSNKIKNQDANLSKKMSITGKLESQKFGVPNSNAGNSMFPIPNKSFKGIKTSGQLTQPGLKQVGNNSNYRYENIAVGSGNISKQSYSGNLPNMSHSFKYPISRNLFDQNHNKNGLNKKSNDQGPQPIGFSYNQIYNLQKTANNNSSYTSSYNKLK